jgi:hypothetical protein
MRTLLLLWVTAALSGCGAIHPSVHYRELASADDMRGMTDAFYLQASMIVVGGNGDTSTDGANGAQHDVTVSSVRVASPWKYGIKATSSWRADTSVNLVKLPNTDVIDSIGVEVVDKTVSAINDYGGAIVALLGVLRMKANQCKFPVEIPIELKDDGKKTLTLSQDCVTVEIGPLPVDAVERARLPQDRPTSNYYYAACRQATVTVEGTSGKRYVRVADPRFVQFVQFPSKGSITSHTQCGVSVQTQQAATDNSAAVANALATQAKAIKDAIAAAKK